MASQDEELWQAYDERGEPIIGKALTKLEARKGALHAASHVWIWRRRGERVEILLQRRARDKHTWPGHLDISAAGHIDLGETPLLAAVREAAEELAFTVKVDDLRLLFVHRTRLLDTHTGIVENEFQWVYGLCVSKLGETRLQAQEVESLEWMPLAEFKQLALSAKDKKAANLIVPHGDAYFGELLKEIARLTP